MTGPGHRGREQRGSATLLMAGVMAVVVVLGGTAMLVTGYLLAQHGARAAADLSALSAAAAFQEGEAGCGQARRTAKGNGARVVSCDRVGDELDFVVTVEVVVDVSTRVPGLPREVRAAAHAEPLR